MILANYRFKNYGYRAQPDLFKDRVGIEVEKELLHNFSSEYLPKKRWEMTVDGSLRGYGFEFRTPPIKPEEVPRYIDDLKELTLLTGTTVNVGNGRCGTHIHFNMLRFTEDEILRKTLLYWALQEPLLKFVTEDRIGNNYCVTFKSNNEVATRLADAILAEGRSLRIFEYFDEAQYKYSGLNLCPLISKGTLEVRSYGECCDPCHFIEWYDLNKLVLLDLNVSALEPSSTAAFLNALTDPIKAVKCMSQGLCTYTVKKLLTAIEQKKEDCLNTALDLNLKLGSSLDLPAPESYRDDQQSFNYEEQA